jgi:hypothetical protein
MEPIPQKYQTRTNRAVYETSQNLQSFAHHLKYAAKQMNLESIDTGKKGGGKPSTLRVSLHSSIDMEDTTKHHTPPSHQKRKGR